MESLFQTQVYCQRCKDIADPFHTNTSGYNFSDEQDIYVLLCDNCVKEYLEKIKKEAK